MTIAAHSTNRFIIRALLDKNLLQETLRFIRALFNFLFDFILPLFDFIKATVKDSIML